MSHAFDRARERYGVALTREEMVDAKRAIAHGRPEAIFLRRQFSSGELYAVLIRGRWMAAVFANNVIVTFAFAPAHALAPFGREIWARKQELRDMQLDRKAQ